MARGDKKKAVSFRFATGTVERLKERSTEVGSGQGALAERYIEEGLRMDGHPGISFRDGGSGRRPALIGTRLDVADVIETLRQNSSSVDQTADYLDLSPAQVETAVRYYAEYQGEVDAWIAQSQAIAARERELGMKRTAALAR
jgi:uncharacterized protein (DUF433 family)